MSIRSPCTSRTRLAAKPPSNACRTRLYQKDLRIANEAAAANSVAIPTTAIVTQLVNALVASGGADLDYAALGTVLLKMANG